MTVFPAPAVTVKAECHFHDGTGTVRYFGQGAPMVVRDHHTPKPPIFGMPHYG